MAFIPIADTVKVVLEYLLDGQQVANVFHVDANATVTDVIMDAIIDEFVAWATDELLVLLSQDISLTGVTARDMTTATGGLIERPIDPPIVGSVAFQSLPGNVAVCVTWYTPIAGRSFRGRSYFPGIAENYTDIAQLGPTNATAFAVASVELVNMIDALGYSLGVASLQTANAPRVTGVITPIDAAGCNTVTDSQRRRLPGRGN